MSLNPEIIEGSLEPKLLNEEKQSKVQKYENVQFEAKCIAEDSKTYKIQNGTLYLTNSRLIIIADSKN